jgi:hypothetical protein
MSIAAWHGARRLTVALRALVTAAITLAILLPGTTSAEVATVLIDLPWRSQVDGQPDQRANSGPAALGMVLAAYGQEWSTGSLRQELDAFGGTAHSTASSASLLALARVHGLKATLLPDPHELWPLLTAGRPALLLLDTANGPARDRWVVAVGYSTTNQLLYDDPAWPVAGLGQNRVMTPAEQAAWRAGGGVGFWLERDGLVSPLPSTPSAAPAAPAASPGWWHMIEAYADWFGIDPFFVAAVLLVESGGNPAAVGDQGHSVGLMQLHDAGVGRGLFELRYDPLLNIWYGAQALAEGMRLYGDPSLAYSRYYNPGGDNAARQVMARYRALQALAETSPGDH